MRSQVILLIEAIVLTCLLLALTAQAAEVSIKSILDDPAKYDGHNVTVKGKALSVKPTASRRGNAYTTFQWLKRMGSMALGPRRFP